MNNVITISSKSISRFTQYHEIINLAKMGKTFFFLSDSLTHHQNLIHNSSDLQDIINEFITCISSKIENFRDRK